ncbi:hypothetical protein PIB30_043899 [Stylosanthes scabra]|uniref:TLDc domain-containing protein n=1 Tax=Stylosanthes scabra TaxID=79078 RepID=A0ABU6TFC9_9FABA|nr:hypothetical protein [Stylosanthes scabra]
MPSRQGHHGAVVASDLIAAWSETADPPSPPLRDLHRNATTSFFRVSCWSAPTYNNFIGFFHAIDWKVTSSNNFIPDFCVNEDYVFIHGRRSDSSGERFQGVGALDDPIRLFRCLVLG